MSSVSDPRLDKISFVTTEVAQTIATRSDPKIIVWEIMAAVIRLYGCKKENSGVVSELLLLPL